MTEYVADLAPDEIQDIEYTRVDAEQAAFMRSAMELPENQAKFDVTFLPIGTAEERLAAAQEWAAYEQAKGRVEARERGAFLIVTTRDRSPEYFLWLIEDRDPALLVPYAPFTTYAVSKIVKKVEGASTYDLLRDYYEKVK